MLKLKVATRQSPMALAQTELVCQRFKALRPDVDITLLPMVSEGDKNLEASLAKVGGKGLFIKELESALLKGEADFAVHSAKDLPYSLHEKFCLPAILKRDNPFDAFVSNQFSSLDALPEGATVGTSSLRRQALLLHQRPDLNITFLRGNVNTRLKRLDDGDFDAIILAVAGLARLGFSGRVREVLQPPLFLPAIAQGALAIECRADNVDLIDLFSVMNDEATHACIAAEREISKALEASCHSPVAAFAHYDKRQLQLEALVASPDGKTIVTASDAVSQNENATLLGRRVADSLIKKGVMDILE